MKDFTRSIDKELPKTLKDKVVAHRENFKRLFRARYLEMLPSLIKYKNAHQVAVDFMKVEVALRNNYDVVIGETVNNNIQVIGWSTSKQTIGDPSNLWETKKLRKENINFVIPEALRLPDYQEITHQDSCQSGNFVVLRNKTINYVPDLRILDHYIDELAEIVLSRFSISMQVKITTLFLGDVNDETTNELVSDIYNGNPYIKASKLFDPNDQIYHMNNDNVAQNFQELKREYQNKISELNNMLGMNSLAVEKSSGVSDTEANSNRAYTTSNANIYLDGRNNGLFKLNKRYQEFGLALEAMYNDEVVSEFQELAKEEGEEGDNDPI